MNALPSAIGPCDITSLLGSGAWGVVYRATLREDREYACAGGVVAVKVLNANRVGDPAVLERFQKEASLGQSIEHPAVVRTHETGVHAADGQSLHYLIMEFVDGRTLDVLISELGALPDPLMRELAVQCADALAAIHDQGAIHRDLKPSNILITPEYRVKLMDMGIALLVEETARLTQEGFFVGTFGYASPEQLSGKPLGPASDLYSLGVVLFEAATGTQPFAVGGVKGIVDRHLHQPADPASVHNPEVSPFVEEVLRQLLAKDPRKRFASASELAAILRAGESSAWWQEQQSRVSDRRRGQKAQIRVHRDTPFTGRQDELQALAAAWLPARSGDGRVVLVSGEAGVGKSRLLDRFVSGAAADGERFLLVYGTEEPGLPAGSAGVLRALGRLVEYPEFSLDMPALLGTNPALTAGFEALIRGEPLPPHAEPVPKDVAPVFASKFLKSLARERPLVVVIEDLQHASREGRELFTALAWAVRGTPILLVGTHRRILDDEALEALQEEDHVTTIQLPRLSPQEVQSLLSESLGGDTAHRSLSREIVEKSDGNPFFISEMLRELHNQAATVVGERQPLGTAPLPVPANVRALLEKRLSAIAAEDRALLDLAATQGYEFSPELLAAVRGRPLLETLERLVALERRPGIVRSERGDFRFDHHLLREVIAEHIPESLSRAYHGALAEAMEAHPGALEGVRAVFLAEHFVKGGLAERAIEAFLPALDYLAARFASARVHELAELALCSLPANARALRADILFRRGDAAFLSGDREAEREFAREAGQLAAALGDPPREARARLMEARSLVDSGAEAMPLLEDAVARARASGDPALEADALEQWGHGFVRAGNFAEATARYRRQMEAAQAIGDSRRVAEAGYYLGEALLGSGQVAAARDQLEASIREFSRHGATRSEARAMADLATAYAMLGRPADANATFEQSLARCRSIGFLEGEALALGNYSKTVILEGRLDRAGELMENWRECNQVLRSPFFDAYWLLHSGDYYWARQDLDQARVFYTEAVSAFRKLGAVYGEADALVSLARVHAAANAPKDSARRAREAQDLVEANGLAEPDPLPRAYLARAGRIPASEVTVPEARQAPVRAEAHLVLHEAGAAGPHLESALEILEAMSSHLTGEDARLFWIHNPVARRARAAETGGAA